MPSRASPAISSNNSSTIIGARPSVPEPTTLALVGVALAAGGLMRRRR
ncbi:MAG: PEP-CTERM sorting domain-containing protein [Methylotenera sp.]|nr:PEP-CTERM sorting domain-containing protein [Methylotenera sp.]